MWTQFPSFHTFYFERTKESIKFSLTPVLKFSFLIGWRRDAYVRRRFLNSSRWNSNIEDGEYETAKRPQMSPFTAAASSTSPAGCIQSGAVDVKSATSLFRRVHTVSISVFLGSEAPFGNGSTITWQLSSSVLRNSLQQAASTVFFCTVIFKFVMFAHQPLFLSV